MHRGYHKWVIFGLVSLACGLFGGQAQANVPMLPFFVFVKIGMWWVVLIALVIETVAIRFLFSREWREAARIAVVVNTASLCFGFVLYPLAGLLGYALLEDMIVDMFGASDVVEISALWLGSSVVDAIVELLALRAMYAIRANPLQTLAFFLANLASAGILVVVMAWEAHVPLMSEEEAARVEAEYAEEIAFIGKVVSEFPAHIDPKFKRTGFVPPDREWTDSILASVDGLRIRTIALTVPPTTVWIKGSTALWEIEAKFRAGNRVLERGLFDTHLAGNRFEATGDHHYRYSVTLKENGVTYEVKAVFRN